MKTQRCAACGRDVPSNGRGLFGQHSCPEKGKDASGPGFPVCPVHGTLVWVVGAYSTFRGCTEPRCTAGDKGAPWRVTARTVVVPSGPGPSHTPTQSSAADVAAPTAPDAGLAMLGPLGQAIQTYVDVRSRMLAQEIVAEAMESAPSRGPARVEWTVNDRPFAVVEGTHHKVLPRLLKLHAAGFRNFLVVGPAGSGKTTLARDLSRALTRPDAPCGFSSVSCTAGMSESALTGRALPNLTDGTTVYQSTDFVRTYEGGGVFLIDEVDAADPNVMLVINSALANGHMPLPNRTEAPSAERHPDAVVICAANTWGRGADRQYVGRNQLDAAFLDRFVGATVEADYDRDLEAALVGDAHICAAVWVIRDKVLGLKLRRVVGTRFLLAVTRLVRGAGETLADAIEACCIDWTPDERTKAGIGGAP